MDDGDTVQELTNRLASDGFVLLDRFCKRELTEWILEVSRRRIRAMRAAPGARQIGISSAAGYEEIVQRSPGRWDIPVTPKQFGFDETALPWSPLVAAVLGADAEHSFSGVVFSDPASPVQCWHTDSPHISVDHLPAHAVNVMVALHDIPMKLGPTEFARGSHVLTNRLNNPTLVRDELIYQHAGTSPEWLVKDTQNQSPERCASELAAGSCLVFDDRILHRGLANQSNSTRHIAYFSYRQKGYAENTHFESRQSLLDP